MERVLREVVGGGEWVKGDKISAFTCAPLMPIIRA